MVLPVSGSLSFSDIRSEFGDTGSISFADMYRGGTIIPDNYTNTDSVPSSGSIDLLDFRGLRLEGTTLDKLADFQSYRLNSLIYRSSENPVDGIIKTSDISQVNGPEGRYNSTWYIDHDAKNRSNEHASSQWTTLIGIVGGAANGLVSTQINSGTNHYKDGNIGTSTLVVNHIKTPHRDISNTIRFTYDRSAGNVGAWALFAYMPGKWEYSSSHTTTFTLGAGKIACAAYGRGGDGPIGYNAVANSYAGFTETSHGGWWYNNGVASIMANNSALSKTVTMTPEINEDKIWVLEEVL